jgi:selenocysteine lyase/cysteine desulfurase
LSLLPLQPSRLPYPARILTAMKSPEYDLDAVRSQIPILRTHIPMNNCSQAPQCSATRAAADTYLTSWNEAGMDWDAWVGEVEAARAEFAAFVGAQATDVAIATSVSQATASIASGLDFTGERCGVVASGGEFPTVGHVWLAQERFGAEVSWVPVRDGMMHLDDYTSAITERTLVVSACRGYYQTGFKQDVGAIAELAHEQGALLYVDAYQTMGSEVFDAPASGADFVASGNLKFLMGIPGIAFLWVRPGIAEQLEPSITGWFGREDPFAFDVHRLDWGAGARRLDTGTPPVVEAYVARAGMAWMRELGIAAIADWDTHLGLHAMQGALARGLEVMGPAEGLHAPTTAIACADSHAIEAALRARGIIASARGPAIRFAPHFYNTTDDVDQALDALTDVMAAAE